MIDETKAEAALDYLVKKAGVIAKAKAELVYIQEYKSSLKAILMQKSGKDSVAAQEVAAYASNEYREHLEALRIATEAFEKLKWLATAAELQIELYRTTAANNRAQTKLTN